MKYFWKARAMKEVSPPDKIQISKTKYIKSRRFLQNFLGLLRKKLEKHQKLNIMETVKETQTEDGMRFYID